MCHSILESFLLCAGEVLGQCYSSSNTTKCTDADFLFCLVPSRASLKFVFKL